MRSELRHLNERHAVLRGKYSSLSDHALSLEGTLEEALIALDDQKPEEAKGLLGIALAAAKQRNETETPRCLRSRWLGSKPAG